MPGGREQLHPQNEARFWSGVAYATRFFMGEADVQQALLKLARLLDEAGIPYAVVGAMALNEYGYRRVTVDVDILLTREGLDALRARALGRGYVEKFPGSRGLRDTEHNVPIAVVVSGEYPGDGRPKPVRFPDPAQEAGVGYQRAAPPARPCRRPRTDPCRAAPRSAGRGPRRLGARQVSRALAGRADR